MSATASRRHRRTWTYEVAYAALVLLASLIILSPVLRRAGWPLNQGSTAPVLLVQMYAAHFRHLDFFPVWSSSDGIGLGSPVLLYYHRAFFYVAGMVYAVFGGHLKFAVVATIAIFLVIGAYGMRQALGVVTESRLLRTVGSLGFLFTNYAFTDWLDPRGDLAEFSAMMVVPWLLYCCLTLVRDRRVSLLLIPVMVLLVNAHSAIALYSLFPLTIALIIFIATAGLEGLRRVARRLLIVVGATVLLLVPLLAAEIKMGRFYDPSTKNSLAAAISQQFVSFGSYFYGIGHQWFLPKAGYYFVQIDFGIWVPIAVALAGAVFCWMRARQKGVRWRPARGASSPAVLFVAASLGVFLFLQWRASLFLYQIIVPLRVTNFPWRMLSFITPLGVVLLVVVADGALRRYSSRMAWGALCAVWFASLLVLSPIASPVKVNYGLLTRAGGFPPMTIFTAPTYVDYRTFNGFFIGETDGELYLIFLPRVLNAQGAEVDDGFLYSALHADQSGAQSLSAVPCTVVGPANAPFETLQLTFSVACAGATRLALPISYNASSSLFVKQNGVLHPIRYSHVPTDPRIVIHVVSSRPETVVVHLPTLWGILF